MKNNILNIFKKISRKIKDKLSLSGKGERVDINRNTYQNFENLDMYQKSHIKRYEFARGLLKEEDIVADFACGTGYGTVMLSENSNKVLGLDINEKVIQTIKKRYANNPKVDFIHSNILEINYDNYFDKIISFETIEHLTEEEILVVLSLFSKALKNNGKLFFSVPYMQEDTKQAIEMGFHKTFHINEQKIQDWLKKTGFQESYFKYQNYETHEIKDALEKKDFIICEAHK